jgi:ElaB/YqjD/DUF883 family membrane-anchored ribosome-binding protein
MLHTRTLGKRLPISLLTTHGTGVPMGGFLRQALTANSRPRRNDMNRDEIRDGVKKAASRARDVADDVLGETREKLNGGLHKAADRAQDAYGEARDTLNGGLHKVAGRAQGAYGEALESIESSAREQPLPALAIALGIGFVIGLLALRR